MLHAAIVVATAVAYAMLRVDGWRHCYNMRRGVSAALRYAL